VRRFLLDTNAFLLLGFGLGEVSRVARDAIADGQRFVSHVSAIEIAIKHSIGKLSLPPTYELGFHHGFAETVRQLTGDLLPIELSHVAALDALPLHHRDPFDRLLIAQAVAENLTIVSRDRKFRLYPGLDLLEF
jgi:PIN domain nuclease of toxin-antitoxin system